MEEELLLINVIQEFLIDNTEEEYCVHFFKNAVIAANAVHFMIMKRDFVPKVLGYTEMVVPDYTMDDFRRHFRLSRVAFEQLLEHVGPTLLLQSLTKEGVAPEKQLLLFLWYMGNPESMREMANLFGISISTVHSAIYRVMDTFQRNLGHVSIFF